MPIDLPINKIGRVSPPLLRRLKKHRISSISQLIAVVDEATSELEFATMADIELAALQQLVRRCRLRQISGIGTIFEILLELGEITSIEQLAAQDDHELYRRLADVNAAERLSRRSPTPEEVTEWVQTARQMTQQ